MLSRVGKLFGGTVAAATVGLALAPVAPAASLPKAVDFWGMQPDALATRPGGLGWTTDLGSSFNGTRGSNSGRGPNSNLSWRRWRANRANGSGDLWVPRGSGEGVSWKRYPARLSFFAPKTLSFAMNDDRASRSEAFTAARIHGAEIELADHAANEARIGAPKRTPNCRISLTAGALRCRQLGRAWMPTVTRRQSATPRRPSVNWPRRRRATSGMRTE